ncbi:MAG: O-antigen ligase family protein [Kiritimatiellae bacterium]|nr:O-antigen ligase family protein [Kiritimatiellia bacterium]
MPATTPQYLSCQRKISLQKIAIAAAFALPIFTVGALYLYYLFATGFCVLVMLSLSRSRLLHLGREFQHIYLKYLVVGTLYLAFTAMISEFGIYWPLRVMLRICFSVVIVALLVLNRDIEVSLRWAVLGLLISHCIMLVRIVWVSGFSVNLIYATGTVFDSDDFEVNRNAIGLMLYSGAFITCLAYYCSFIRLKYAVVLLCAFSFYTVISFSTRSIVSLLLVWAAFLWTLRVKKGVSYIFVFLGLFIWIVLSINVPAIDNMMARLVTFFGAQYDGDYSAGAELSALSRYNLFIEGWDIFREYPWFGVGLENTRLIMGNFTHNDFLELLIGAGIFGPVPFYAIYLAILYHLIRLTRRHNFIMPLIFLFLSPFPIGMAGCLYRQPTAFIYFGLLILAGKYMLLNRARWMVPGPALNNGF